MDPYIGEVRLFAGNFAPQGWALCDGSLLPVSEYETLYTLIGSTYGCDGQTNFALPDLRSRIPMHTGSGSPIGQMAGTESVTLTAAQVGSHNHTLQGIAVSNASSPANAFPAALTGGLKPTLYGTGAGKLTTLAPQSVGPSSGGSQPHGNVQPCLALTFIISLFGIYPSRS